MRGRDADTVAELLAATDDQNWSRVLELMAEDSFTRNSAGRIYVGHDGFAKWLRDTNVSTTARHFETATIRDLGDGFVLVVGAEHRDPRRGAAEAVPGAWLYHLRDGLVRACMYFRTERDALTSLSGPGRDEPVADIAERAFDAFNNDDYVAMVANLDDQLRFSTALHEPGKTHEGIAAFVSILTSIRATYDDVFYESVIVEEVADSHAIATATLRAVNDAGVDRSDVVIAIRVAGGRIVEWFAHADAESARAAIGRSLAAVKHEA
jgi:hypothetical protein